MASEVLIFDNDIIVSNWVKVGSQPTHHDSINLDNERSSIQIQFINKVERIGITTPVGDIDSLVRMDFHVGFVETAVNGAQAISLETKVMRGANLIGSRTIELDDDTSYTRDYTVSLSGGAWEAADMAVIFISRGTGWIATQSIIDIYYVTPELFYTEVGDDDVVVEVAVSGTVSGGVMRGGVAVGDIGGHVSGGETLGRVSAGDVTGRVSSGEVRGTINAQPEPETLTFIMAVDTHYGWQPFGTHWTYAQQLLLVEAMNNIYGTDYPSPLTGSVERPAFVIQPGDVLYDDDDYPTSLETFIAHWGFNGGDGELNYPLYHTKGNHDGEGGAVNDLIVERYGDLKYRFQAAGVHFICLDLFPQAAGTVGDYYLDSACSMAWLQTQLEAIGRNSPVVLFQHYDYGTDFGLDAETYNGWGTADADELAALISEHNIIAILHGHAHDTTLPGAIETYEPFRGYNVVSPYMGSFNVIRITADKFQSVNWNLGSSTWNTANTVNNPISRYGRLE